MAVAGAPPHLQVVMVTDSEIRRLLDRFYAQARVDADLGPIFAAAIPDRDWPAHLDTIADFWSSVMNTTGRYKGNPVAKHAPLPLRPEHFRRWLDLFGEAADAELEPAAAAAMRAKAERIGQSLQLALFYRLG